MNRPNRNTAHRITDSQSAVSPSHIRLNVRRCRIVVRFDRSVHFESVIRQVANQRHSPGIVPSPSPRPSPLGRGSSLARIRKDRTTQTSLPRIGVGETRAAESSSASALTSRCRRFSLSLGERAGVRGKGLASFRVFSRTPGGAL